jgi:hypothetical protein
MNRRDAIEFFDTNKVETVSHFQYGRSSLKGVTCELFSQLASLKSASYLAG